jgi:hypothetical protein
MPRDSSADHLVLLLPYRLCPLPPDAVPAAGSVGLNYYGGLLTESKRVELQKEVGQQLVCVVASSVMSGAVLLVVCILQIEAFMELDRLQRAQLSNTNDVCWMSDPYLPTRAPACRPPRPSPPQLDREKQAEAVLQELASIISRYRGPLLESSVDLEQRLWHLATMTGEVGQGMRG